MDRPVRPPQQHCRGYSMGSELTEKDEDLALFRNMGKRSDQTTFLSLGTGTDDQLIDATLSTEFGGLSHLHSSRPVQRNGVGVELLNSDEDKTDYDWLMTPPATPLIPSMDADSPVLQQGMIMNRSLAAIKTSRVKTGTSSAIKTNRGNPSPSRRSSTPQSSPLSVSAAMRLHNHVPAKSANHNRPATTTKTSTPTSIRASPNPRPSTPTRQTSSPAPARPVTPMGARPATPTRRPATPISSGRASSTPTLRRSSSSATESLAAPGGILTRGYPSPTRNTETSAVRGASPVRSTSSRGVSPLRGDSRAPSARGVSPAPPPRGRSPAPSPRGRSPSPSLRVPYPVEASDAIPPNLRTTSDRSSSAQRRPVVYGANLGEPVPVRSGTPTPPQRRPASPARSTARSSNSVRQNLDKLCRAASSDVDSERSIDTCSQSGVSGHGILTPEKSGSARRMSYGRGSEDYGRSSSLEKAKRGSTTSPQFSGPSTSKTIFESAAREYHRGQVVALRPFTTNSSISTFYSSRASGLLRRPLTPSSTTSSSEHGATVAHHSEVDDEEAGSNWKPLKGQAHEAHSPLHLFENSLTSSLGPGSLDGTSIADNEEMSNFFKDSELPLELGPLTSAYAEKHLCGKAVVKALGSASQIGEMQRSNSEVITHNLDPRSASRLDGDLEEHFDFECFECLGSKRDPSTEVAELPVVSGVGVATTLQDYSVDPAKERNGPFSGNTTSIDFRVEKINGIAKVNGNHADMSTLSKRQSIPGSAENSGVPDTSCSPNAMVLATHPSAKEEIVESTVSPGSRTPKHMSSVKVSHKKSDKPELERSKTARQATEGCKVPQQSDAAAIPGRKSNIKTSEKSAAATAPHVNKEKPGRAASPARPLPAKVKGPRQAESGANGEAPEELSMHSRFSNITVRSGLDTENFDCGSRSLGIFSVSASARSWHLPPVAQTRGRVAKRPGLALGSLHCGGLGKLAAQEVGGRVLGHLCLSRRGISSRAGEMTATFSLNSTPSRSRVCTAFA